MKTQAVRVLDVLLIGPLMIAAALRPLPEPWRIALGVTGFLTILYNARNWQRER